MNEWGFIGQDIFVEIGKSATNNKFKSSPTRPTEHRSGGQCARG